MKTDAISRSELLKLFPVDMENPLWHFTGIRAAIEAAPAIDAVSVVRCECCALHGHCAVEDMFILAGFTDGYCRAGKRLSNAVSSARMDGEAE